MTITFQIALNLPDGDLTEAEQKTFGEILQKKAISALTPEALAIAYDKIDMNRRKIKSAIKIH